MSSTRTKNPNWKRATGTQQRAAARAAERCLHVSRRLHIATDEKHVPRKNPDGSLVIVAAKVGTTYRRPVAE